MLERVSIAVSAVAVLLLAGACDQQPAQSNAAAEAESTAPETADVIVTPAADAGTDDSAPLNEPTGVRAMLAITTSESLIEILLKVRARRHAAARLFAVSSTASCQVLTGGETGLLPMSGNR